MFSSKYIHSLLQEFMFWSSSLLHLFWGDRLPIPVMSVGNMTWGGTGKTPMVEYLAHRFLSVGLCPLILTRVSLAPLPLNHTQVPKSTCMCYIAGMDDGSDGEIFFKVLHASLHAEPWVWMFHWFTAHKMQWAGEANSMLCLNGVCNCVYMYHSMDVSCIGKWVIGCLVTSSVSRMHWYL